MKTKILTLAVVILAAINFVGFTNKQFFDFTYTFDKAIIYLPNGDVISGEVESWTDFDDGDQIQVKIDGVTYLVHSSNIALIAG